MERAAAYRLTTTSVKTLMERSSIASKQTAITSNVSMLSLLMALPREDSVMTLSLTEALWIFTAELSSTTPTSLPI